MTVLDRSELQASPLADLHLIADQIGLEGFRRLRKADLIDAILGEKGPAEDADAGERTATATARRRSVAHARVAPRAHAARARQRRPSRARMSRRSNLPQRSLRPLGAHKGAKAGVRAVSETSPRSPRMASASPRE